MINHNEIELNQFFTMHPFSITQKRIYNSALDGIDFFDAFYVKNNKTYERLATVCNIINNAEKSILVITGYRGCGKTNFLQLIRYLSEGSHRLQTFEELEGIELSCASRSDELKKAIANSYQSSIRKIQNTFFGDLYGIDGDVVGEIFRDYVCTRLSGEYKYINFDDGGMKRDKPFSVKLFYNIRASIRKCEIEGFLPTILELLDSFAKRNRWLIEENFEEIDFRTLKLFWNTVKGKLYSLHDNNDLYDDILEEMKTLSLEQLLFVYTMWEYAVIIVSGKQRGKKLIYLLDNIDIISDGKTDIFKNTMEGIWKYVWDMKNVFEKIRDNQEEKDAAFISLYDKTKFIIAMRETTAMHISGHLRDKLRAIMDHFDMSSDIDKAIVMQRKIDFAQCMIQKKQIRSQGFIEAIKCLNELLTDRIFIKSLFQLFNNDYRTAVMCITTICIEHMDEIKKAISLMRSNKSNLIFGGRGVIYRLIIDGFFEWDYFDAIGIPSIKSKGYTVLLQSNHGFSCARVLLTILCNRQAKNSERFFVNPEESVRLADLYGMVQNLISLEEFVAIIDGMYSLRNKRFWNHLVTFDNILSYSPDVVKNYICINAPQTEEKDIYIRATSAGQIFADIISPHFEYFSSRYSSTSKNISLFLLDNLDKHRHWVAMKKIICDVYSSVEKCMKSLEAYNIKILKIKNVSCYDEILSSPYYYEHQFHEERIIHNHISYLEAYREYLFELQMDEQRLLEANCFLLTMMQQYLDLLKYDANNGYKPFRNLFYSENSRRLYNELSVCIEEIKKCSTIKNGIQVTRDYYFENYNGKQCAFMQQIGDEE